jgi:anti-sigma-K factor RskA
MQDRNVGGEVVWSTAKQQGFMTFEGLPPNDPTKEQYQLWIFDPSQSDKTPIDGGVFDVASTGEVIVPIDPKLRPAGPVMFAITIEKPGGSVVSSRERLVLIAKPT